jgi:DNA-binding transcriptional ArsR family regulator
MTAREISHPATGELDLASVLRALGDPIHLDIVGMLFDGNELTCTQLSEATHMPISTLSYHLRLLREAGVVRSRPAGTERRASLRRQDLDERFPGLLDVLGVDDRVGVTTSD